MKSKNNEHNVILVKDCKMAEKYGLVKVVANLKTIRIIDKREKLQIEKLLSVTCRYLQYAPESKYLFVAKTGSQIPNSYKELDNLCAQIGH